MVPRYSSVRENRNILVAISKRDNCAIPASRYSFSVIVLKALQRMVLFAASYGCYKDMLSLLEPVRFPPENYFGSTILFLGLESHDYR